MINLALGFLVGLAIGVGAAVLLETLDTRIKSIEALAKHFDQPLLGVIGFEAEAEKKPLLTDVPGQSKRAESFRQVRTNLQFVDIDHRPQSIVVTSSVPREGKSTTAINLAITIAQTGQPVFLIEGDLRRPKVADYLGIEGGAGLTDVLVGRATVDEVMQPWGDTGNLWVMASGPLPPNPSELLGSQAMADLVHHLEKRATLIIDAPPLLPVTDAAVLTRLAGGALMIIATGKTRREQLRTAEQNIEARRRQDPRSGDEHGAARAAPTRTATATATSTTTAATDERGKFEDHAPVIPAGLGGLPGVNGSPTPTVPVGRVDAPSKPHEPNSVAEVIEGHMGAPRPASKASVQASAATDVSGLAPVRRRRPRRSPQRCHRALRCRASCRRRRRSSAARRACRWRPATPVVTQPGSRAAARGHRVRCALRPRRRRPAERRGRGAGGPHGGRAGRDLDAAVSTGGARPAHRAVRRGPGGRPSAADPRRVQRVLTPDDRDRPSD